MKLYVASSWRNTYYDSVVKALIVAGHEVYDFKHPEPDNKGFSWLEVDKEWQTWTPWQFVHGLMHPAAEKGFTLDMDALNACEGCVLVLPSGRSAHLEAGYAIGKSKPTFILMPPDSDPVEPELMYKMATAICLDMDELLKVLK